MKPSNTEIVVKQPFKAVISVNGLDCDPALKDKLVISLDSGAGGLPHISTIPTTHPIILDIAKDCTKINAKFLHSDTEQEIASGYITVAPDIAYNVEVDTYNRIETRASAGFTLNDNLGVNFKITYINTILFEERGEPELLRETLGPATRGDTIPLHQRIAPKHPVRNKVYNYDEAMIHDYTKRVITKKLG